MLKKMFLKYPFLWFNLDKGVDQEQTEVETKFS